MAGCYLKREGAEHALWINPKTGAIEAVPRHTEIKEPLANKNLAQSRCLIFILHCKPYQDVSVTIVQ
jgi:hypothetical protein